MTSAILIVHSLEIESTHQLCCSKLLKVSMYALTSMAMPLAPPKINPTILSKKPKPKALRKLETSFPESFMRVKSIINKPKKAITDFTSGLFI